MLVLQTVQYDLGSGEVVAVFVEDAGLHKGTLTNVVLHEAELERQAGVPNWGDEAVLVVAQKALRAQHADAVIQVKVKPRQPDPVNPKPPVPPHRKA